MHCTLTRTLLACYGSPVWAVGQLHFATLLTEYRLLQHTGDKSDLLVVCSAWDDPEFVEAVLRLVLSRLVDSQLGIFAMFNFAVSIYAVGALTTKESCSALA